MAQRVARTGGPLDRLRAGVGRTVRPVLEALSRQGTLSTRGCVVLQGLAGPVTAHMDAHGVPHIRAATDADAFFVQGFFHARDRFFQMDMLRRVLRGRLSEIIGERSLGAMAPPPFGANSTTLDADRLMRALDLLPAAQRVWDEGDAEGRALLGAYVRGVNAGVDALRRNKPLEHRLLGLPLKRWGPADSILVSKGMALGLSFKWRAAPVFAAIGEALQDDPARLAALLPSVPDEGALAIARCVTDGISEALRFLPVDAPTVGSNAWLVGRERTQSGKPIVASDPHLELSLPSIWYLASVKGRSYGAVGATLPGLPGVVVGRTQHVAWGLTNGMLDDCDLWVEELSEDGGRYRVDGAWRDLDVETQRIPRRRTSATTFRLRRTHRGPLISDAFPGYDGPPLSLRMTLHEPTGDMQAFLGLGRARTVAEALEAATTFGSPAQNLLVADTQGRSAYRLLGLVPQRAAVGHPAFPRDGTSSRTDWQGWVPDSELPQLEVGPRDQLVSSNHPVVDGTYPHYLSHLYEPDYRAARIGACLVGRSDLTAADMEALQADAVSLAAPRFRRAVLEPHAAAVRRLRPTLGPLLDRLLAWDGTETKDAKAARPWHLVYHHLARRIFEPTLGTQLTRHWMGLMNLLDEPLLTAFEAEDSPWAGPDDRAGLLLDALEATSRALQASGEDLDAPWGVAHTLTLRHPAGSAAPLGATFNRGPYALDGGPYSVCSGQYFHSRPGPMVVGQSYLHVVDLAAPEDAGMITLGGQSGHVGSPHYDDLTPLWLAGERIPMRLENLPETDEVLTFVPR